MIDDVNHLNFNARTISVEVNEAGRYPCKQCRASYKNRSHLLRHLRFECGVEPQFECYHCGKKFTRDTTLKTHLKNIHKIEMNYT